ncbi:MAG: hypothetical protein IH986_12700 [Planctomycetes bacterium]|nr:hypothetical protein [Planctomycetota bacterium]
MTPVARPLYTLLMLAATASALAQDLDFRLVAVSTPTGSSTTTTLPGSISDVCVGETFFVEFWVSDVGSTNTGVSSAYVDLSWPSTLATAVSIDHGTLYNALSSGTIAAGSIDELGGSLLSATGVGIEPEWARVAVVELTADAAGAAAFSLSSSTTGAAALGRGVIAWANIALSGVTVTVNPLPNDPTGAVATPATICAGDSSTLSATVGAGGDALEWFEGSCGGTPVAGQSPTVSPAATTNYFVRSLNTATGCFSACVQVTVTVNPLPSVPTGAAATPATICAGGSSTLSAAVGAGGDVLEWFEGSCGGTPVAGQSPVVSPAVTTDYFVRSVNTTTGCVSACVQVTVTVNSLPSDPTGAVATPATICPGETSTLSATVGAGGDALEWFEGTCGGTSVAGQSPVVSPAVTTDYFVRSVNTTTGCVGACVQVTVTVNPTISGTVTTALTNPLSGVQVSADNGGGSDTTDASGDYQLCVPNGWSGTVTPCLTGWRFAPPDLSFANVTAPVSGADFIGTQVYDLDPPSGGDEFVGVGDFSFFAPSWQQSVPPNHPSDFDCDGFVGSGDFSFFVTAWLKSVFDATISYPACRQCSGVRLHSLLKLPRPSAPDAIHATDLLLNDARVPFRMEKDHHAAGLVEVEAFSADQRLRDEDAWVTLPPVERELQSASGRERGRTAHQSRESAAVGPVLLPETLGDPCPQRAGLVGVEGAVTVRIPLTAFAERRDQGDEGLGDSLRGRTRAARTGISRRL